MDDYDVGFPYNGNPVVNDAYLKSNYKIMYTKSKKKNAIVFFSSNGIYSENTEKEFIDIIIEKDSYDWENISKNRVIKQYFSKVVFVRDIYKQWYVTGINKQINSVEKVVELLLKELSGLQITTCGSSAGGYMAVLVGAMLKAKRIVTSSGQFVLDINNSGPLIAKYSIDSRKAQYFDLRPIMKSMTDSVFYFYPSKSPDDILQNNYVKDAKLHRFAMDTEAHGQTINGSCFPYVLTMEEKRLIYLSNKFSGQLIDIDTFYKEVVPRKDRLMIVLFKLKRKMIHLFRKIFDNFD